MIQSAEKFAEELSREAHGRGLTAKMSDFIRSRDKAIIDACKALAKKNRWNSSVFDSVLRDEIMQDKE